MSAAALPQLRGWQRRPLHRMAQRLASWSNASGCLRCLPRASAHPIHARPSSSQRGPPDSGRLQGGVRHH